MLFFESNKDENTLVCFFSGKLNAEKSNEMAPQLDKKIDEARDEMKGLQVRFDLEDVDYIASGFIRICMKTVQTVGKENFAIVRSNPMIKKTFKITGLDEELNVS